MLGFAAVIGVLWLIGQSDKNTTSPAQAYSPPAQTATPSYSPPPAEPLAPSRPQESMPPVGQNQVLSTAQIRYCLAEEIRMDGAKSAINNYIESDVDRFNAMVADYNSRCGNFRYRSGMLENARREIEPYRSQFQSEGRSRFVRSPSTGSLSAPAPSRPAPDATVQAIQRKLNELGYEAGTADGLMGRGTRSAILAFQRDNGLVADGNARAALLQLLTVTRQVERQGAQVPAPSVTVAPPTYTPPARASSRQESTNPTSGGIPQHAHLNYLGNGWECNRGYYRSGNECQPVQMPRYATLDVYGSGWVCQSGYFKSGNECQPVQMPQNATLDVYGSGWVCQRGYYRSANECLPVQMPRYATLDVYGSGWVCQRGYYKSANECLPVQMPPNATLDVYGSGWVCQRGFYKSVNQCLPVQIPQNATLDVYGAGWACIQGYARVGDSCAAN
ncbi:MAG: peptidoglycan-binding protein [Gammaproteobacteria bacterium]|nr:peptidoglycan-binding protein [Gammaproteobacteria bacterium]MBU1441461.1 peptidoglycan-binding protein [Gammaproteobacteria bacterium]MBU2287292.1 peptidoglycan-binding protein [Gammaproteobacteria bacterium]MBU2408140.1 peptidoglycan-binding protein [Gammaproteobacteria bacterium]